MRGSDNAKSGAEPTPSDAGGQNTVAALLTIVRELLAETQPQRSKRITLTLDSRLGEDLGLDSLARVELISRIEDRFSVGFPERAFTEANTPRDLLRLLATAHAQPSTATRATVKVESQPDREQGVPDTKLT